MKRTITTLLIVLSLVVSLSIGVLASFTDVKDPSWYGESVNYAVDHGYMAGMGNDLFAPNGLVTRAQLTQILYAAENKPEISQDSPFTDVPKSGKWYSSAVLWGAKNQIVAGYPDKAFRPDQPVTREQLVSVLYKYAQYKNYAEASEGDEKVLSGFSDKDKVAAYARPGMIWAVQNGIISGTNIGLEPKGNATRAQMAVIIHAFMTKVAKDASGEPEDGGSKDDNESKEDDSSKDDNESKESDSSKDDPETSPSPSVSPSASESSSPSVSPSQSTSPSPSVSPSSSASPEDGSVLDDDDNSSTSSSGSGNGSGSGSGNGTGNGNRSKDNNELPLVPAS